MTAAAPGGQVRVVNLSFTPVEEVFRTELRAWLREHVPGGAPAAPSLADEVRELRAWQRTLHGGGWVGIHWPRAYGGRGASAVEHYILQEELAAWQQGSAEALALVERLADEEDAHEKR